jgi:hypothetical protein
MGKQFGGLPMDFAVLSKPGIGVQTTLKDSLTGQGPFLVIRMEYAGDIGPVIQESIDGSNGKPMTLLLDACSLPDISEWASPLKSVLSSRAIGGVVLPEGSSIILQLHAGDEFKKLPETLTSMMKVVDVGEIVDQAKAQPNAVAMGSVRNQIAAALTAVASDIVLDRLHVKVSARSAEIERSRNSQSQDPSI